MVEDMVSCRIHKKDKAKVASPIGCIHLYHHFSGCVCDLTV